ncbi:MAG: TlyA family rRNA (cytidine-2'-O)-methyltransferase [Spirochaetales bacterium]|nr:MAG: TlyA family rRNA (cytidine-2'-O)-methyltransferase [Spirochaetales bacterium]
MKKLKLLHILTDRFPDIPVKELYARVLCGEVMVEGGTVKDPSAAVSPEAAVIFKKRTYVSRGGEKLEHALSTWQVPVRGKIWLDAGASTGGFTHCLLTFGAEMVHAVDVGKNQIDYRLRQDRRVILHEGTNIMEHEKFDPAPDAAVADLSFRSIAGAAEHILQMTKEDLLIALIKPQFEFRSPGRAFRGVVTSNSDLKRILEEVIGELSGRGLAVQSVLPSPITGRRGNREYFFRLGTRKGGEKPAQLLDGIL